MTTPSTRDAIVAVAREMFARRGYTATTIKDIAAAAGCSPALVMKLTGSKAELFAAADPSAVVLEEPRVAPPAGGRSDALESVGCQLVRRVVDRRDNGEPDALSMAPTLIHEAGDPDTVRDGIRTRYVAAVAERIGDTGADHVRSQLVLTVLLGLAGAMRHVGLLAPDVVEREELIRRYGALVQAVIDG